MSDIETTSLPAHVSICQERYRSLENRFIVVNDRLDRMARVLEDIQTDMQTLAAGQSDRWNTAQIAVIGVLLSIIGALATMVVSL